MAAILRAAPGRRAELGASLRNGSALPYQPCNHPLVAAQGGPVQSRSAVETGGPPPTPVPRRAVGAEPPCPPPDGRLRPARTVLFGPGHRESPHPLANASTDSSATCRARSSASASGSYALTVRDVADRVGLEQSHPRLPDVGSFGWIEIPHAQQDQVGVRHRCEARDRRGHLPPATSSQHREGHAVEKAGCGRLGCVEVPVAVEPEHPHGPVESRDHPHRSEAVAGENQRKPPLLAGLAHVLG